MINYISKLLSPLYRTLEVFETKKIDFLYYNNYFIIIKKTMKRLHDKTANDIILDLIDDGIEMTPEMGKVVKILVDTYGNEDTDCAY